MKIEELVVKSVSQKLTLQEERELFIWINESDENKNEYIRLQKLYSLLLFECDYDAPREQKLLNTLTKNIAKEQKISLTKKIVVSTFIASAVLLFSALVYDGTKTESIKYEEFKFIAENNSETIRDTIRISGNPKAYLTTTSGVISIENKEKIITQIDTSLQKTSDKVIYNTITVPEKGQFEITLSDNTKVLLNGGSSLTYPIKFAENERAVLLSGEAYFQVTTNPNHPFVVMAKNTKSIVYGTKINVSAYPDSKYVATTLFSGKVKVNDIELKPGQRAIKPDLSNDVHVSSVNLDVISSWTRGVFYFDNASLESIMEQLSQWYGVKVNFENQIVKEEKFTIVFKRSEELEYALKLISNTKKVKLKSIMNELYVETIY